MFRVWARVQARPYFTSCWGLFSYGVCLAYLTTVDLKRFVEMGITGQKRPARREPVLRLMASNKDTRSQRIEKEVVPSGDA